MAVDAEEVGISLYNLETWSEYALYYWVRDCFRVDSGTCSVTWNKGKAAKILTCLDDCVCARFQFSFDLVSNLVNESGDAYRWCSRSGPYTLLIVDMVSIPFDSCSSGADNIPTTGVFTLSQCRGLFWVRYVIVRLCFWWRLCQACFAAHSPKDATSSDLNEQQSLDYYDSVGRSLRCWNRWNGTTKSETAAEEERMKCTSFMHAVCREVSSIGSLAPSIRWAPRLVTSRDTQCNGYFSRPRFAAFKLYLLQRISNVLKRYCHDCLVSGDSSDVHFSQLKTRQVMSSQCFNLSESPWRKPMFQKGRKGAYFYLSNGEGSGWWPEAHSDE